MQKKLSFGCLLDVFWMCFGCLLDVFRMSFGCLLDVFWMSFGCLLDVFWMCFGCLLDVFWMSFGCLLDVFWMSFGCVSDVFWMCFGCLLDVFWMSFGCLLEQIYCKFTVFILFDNRFQKDSDIVSDIFKIETFSFPFTKHRPSINPPFLTFPVVASPGWFPLTSPGVVPRARAGSSRGVEATPGRSAATPRSPQLGLEPWESQRGGPVSGFMLERNMLSGCMLGKWKRKCFSPT